MLSKVLPEKSIIIILYKNEGIMGVSFFFLQACKVFSLAGHRK